MQITGGNGSCASAQRDRAFTRNTTTTCKPSATTGQHVGRSQTNKSIFTAERSVRRHRRRSVRPSDHHTRLRQAERRFRATRYTAVRRRLLRCNVLLKDEPPAFHIGREVFARVV